MPAHDIIHLTGLEFYAYHGVLPEEAVLGQRFILDIDLYSDLHKAEETDEVADTINYAEVYQLVQSCVQNRRYRLLERLAEEIAREILAGFPCSAVRLILHKPQAPLPGIFRDISIEIFRERTDI